jgi:hypothetical protein
VIIEQAKGVLSNRGHINIDEAFKVLRATPAPTTGSSPNSPARS